MTKLLGILGIVSKLLIGWIVIIGIFLGIFVIIFLVTTIPYGPFVIIGGVLIGGLSILAYLIGLELLGD